MTDMGRFRPLNERNFDASERRLMARTCPRDHVHVTSGLAPAAVIRADIFKLELIIPYAMSSVSPVPMLPLTVGRSEGYLYEA